MKIKMGVSVNSNLSNFSDAVKDRMTEIVKKTTEQVSAEYKEMITSGSRSGREYNGHRASAPGEPPASLSGDLAESMRAEFPKPLEGLAISRFKGKKGNKKGLGVTAGNITFYAHMLEFGTHRIAARPALRPVVERTRPEFEKETAKAVRGAAKSSEIK